MIPEGPEEGQGPNGGDDGRPRDESQYQPGGPNDPGYMGTPVARKLALDLSNVAGFAILDDSTDSAGAPAGARTLSATGSSTMWLESRLSGQVLVRGQGGLEQPSLGGIDVTGSGVPRLPGLISQDPSAEPPPREEIPLPSGDDPTAPTGELPESDDPVQQAGLMKINADGTAEPALVLLEEQVVEDTSDEGEGEGEGEIPSDDRPTDGTGGFAGAGAGGAGGDGVAGDGAATGGRDGETRDGEPRDGAPRPGAGTPPPQHYEPLPRVTAVGLSPDGNVYILFERAFLYRQPSPEEMRDGFDPYALDSGYRCQLFRARGDWRGETPNAAASELECVTNEYEIRTWDPRRVMQFDAQGRLYFRASIPNQPNELFYMYDPTTGELTAKINANVCWRDVQVTPRGSVFYTGQSNGQAGACSGSSFFRYVSEDNQLSEIARDWWDFKYLAEQDPDAPDNERIIFYGPDPAAASAQNAWQTACLYRYNPAAPEAERTQRLVDCIPDAWTYVNELCSDSDFQGEEAANCIDRCVADGQLFIGGQGVKELSQMSDGTLFVAGTFQRKVAGEISCSLSVTVDHCAESTSYAAGTPVFPELDQAACAEAGYVWRTKDGYCNGFDTDNFVTCSENSGAWINGFGDQVFYSEQEAEACATQQEGFSIDWMSCLPAGGNYSAANGFAQEVNGVAYLVPRDDASTNEIKLVSGDSEKVERYWPINNASGSRIFYSVYQSGVYSLRMAVRTDTGVERREVLSGYEVYNLQPDPANDNRVLFDALHFGTNSYVFGSIDPTLPTPEAVAQSLQVVSGISGKVETLIVLPNF